MVRFVLRKALSSIRKSLREKNKELTTKTASLLLCQRYFKEKMKELSEEKMNTINKEEEIMSFLLPYKKKSPEIRQ